MLFILSSISFFSGVGCRAWAAEQTGVAAYTSDFFAVSGYFLASLALIVILRRRIGVQRHAVVDGIIVALGAG